MGKMGNVIFVSYLSALPNQILNEGFQFFCNNPHSARTVTKN
jgi:hypothetical protein